jgi:hypothetical protein
MPSPSPLTRRPQATAFSIEDLLDRVRRGEVRVPEFQRPLRWQAKDVLVLMDSIYRGYPIGTLLFWKREAPAASVSFGPVRIDAPHSTQALWVVDGQQRITALTGVLLNPTPAEHGVPDDFTLFFDLEREDFVRLSAHVRPQPHWLPMNVVLDSEQLLSWLDRYPGRVEHPEHTRAALRLGKAIREYQIPAYIVDADEEKTLRVIFERLNSAGKPLRQDEVFNALHGGGDKAQPSDLRDLAQSLKPLGFGAIDAQWLLKAVLATRGLDITRSFRQQLKDEHDLTEALRHTERALRDTLVFIKRDVGIPHIELLPYKLPLVFLARFFHLHPEPSARTRELLSRWVWRGAITEHHKGQSTQAVRQELAAIDSREEHSMQRLLAALPRPDAMSKLIAGLPDVRRFNFRTAQTKLQLNALLATQPRHLKTSQPINAPLLLEQHGAASFPLIFASTPPKARTATPEMLEEFQRMRHGLANRIFHPPLDKQSVLTALRTPPLPEQSTLDSHVIPAPAYVWFTLGDDHGFLAFRAHFLQQHIKKFLDAKARWQESDRQSLQSLIVPDEDY